MGRYSRTVRVNDIIETTPTAAVDPDGEVIAKGDLYEQSRVALQTISDALEELAPRCGTWSRSGSSPPT